MLDVTFYVLIGVIVGALIAFFAIKSTKSEEVVKIIEKEKPEPLLPYWAYYGQPSYFPYYLSSYWLYDVPYYGPITGGSYKPWGHGRYNMYKPNHWSGRGFGHSGVAVGGGGGGHGGH
jgi:hypothetical protein